MPTNYYSKLSLSKHYNQVFHIIREYLEYRQQWKPGQECFTYKGLYNWYIKRQNGSLHWHTIERVIRRMAEDGWFYRIPRGKIMIFCLSKYFKQALAEYQQLVNRGGLRTGGELIG